MPTYRIASPASGRILGEYTADTEAGALDALARDANYTDFRAACDVTGDDPENPDLVITLVTPTEQE